MIPKNVEMKEPSQEPLPGGKWGQGCSIGLVIGLLTFSASCLVSSEYIARRYGSQTDVGIMFECGIPLSLLLGIIAGVAVTYWVVKSKKE